MESCIARPLLICANLLKIPHITKRSTKMYAMLRCGGNLPLCLAFGTGEGHLWYGICVPCSKRLPGVRDASSEAFGVKNRLLRYGRDIRCQKQAPVVRDASSKARRTADSTDCGQPPAAPDASSVRGTAPLFSYPKHRVPPPNP